MLGAGRAGGIGDNSSVLLMLKTPAQAFSGEHAGEKVQVAFAVLGADRVDGLGRGDVAGEVGLGVVGEQLGDDGLGMLVMKDQAVAANPQKGEERFEAQPVTGEATIGSQPGGFGAVAVPGASLAVGL